METYHANLIPKTIHYCWFGDGKKPAAFDRYLTSRAEHCPDYTIIERNEQSIDFSFSAYCRRAYGKKKWAFLVDYLRFYILFHQWGIYLDTDIQLTNTLDGFLHHDCFLWFESNTKVNGAVLWAQAGQWLMREVLDYFDQHPYLSFPDTLLPILLTRILRKYGLKCVNQSQYIQWVQVYTKEYFYPFSYYDLASAKEQWVWITDSTFAIHRNEAAWLPDQVKKLWFPLIRNYHKILHKLTF